MFEGTLHLDAGARSLFGLIYSGIIGSGLCYFLWFGIVRRLPASTAALGILASPVIGVITAMIVLGERPTWYDAIGFAFMLCGLGDRGAAAGRRDGGWAVIRFPHP